jgi:hypothetical protein
VARSARGSRRVGPRLARLGHVEHRKGEGKEAAGRAGLGSQLSFGPRPFRD